QHFDPQRPQRLAPHRRLQHVEIQAEILRPIHDRIRRPHPLETQHPHVKLVELNFDARPADQTGILHRHQLHRQRLGHAPSPILHRLEFSGDFVQVDGLIKIGFPLIHSTTLKMIFSSAFAPSRLPSLISLPANSFPTPARPSTARSASSHRSSPRESTPIPFPPRPPASQRPARHAPAAAVYSPPLPFSAAEIR